MKARTKMLLTTIASIAFAISIATLGFTAEVFVPVTPNKKVSSKDKVKIKKVVTEEKVVETVYSLPKEQERLADLIAKRDALNTMIAEQEALLAKIQTEVDKVELFTSPEPDFSYSVDKGTVTFADKSTGDIDAWSWNFGDGTTSEVQNPKHTYKVNGDFTVTLTVTAPDGLSYTVSNIIQISGLLSEVLPVE